MQSVSEKKFTSDVRNKMVFDGTIVNITNEKCSEVKSNSNLNPDPKPGRRRRKAMLSPGLGFTLTLTQHNL
jgi:hypothetical protein